MGIVAAAFTDTGQSDTDEIGTAFGGVALEVSMKFSFGDSTKELIIRLGEVIHADHSIAIAFKKRYGMLKDLEFDIRRGECGLVKLSHGLFEPRDMGIVEHCQPVGLDTECFFECLGEAFKGLIRQPIDQIHIDTLDTILSG